MVGYHREGIALEIVVMSIRNGQLNGSRGYSFTGQEFPDAELISSFVGLYYDLGAPPPDEVLLPIEIEDAALKAEWLDEKRAALPGRHKKVEVLVPQRGRPQASSSIWPTRTRRPASPPGATRAPTWSWRSASCSGASSCRSCRA